MVRKFFIRFRKDETGAAMVEYAIALLVAAALGTTMFTVMGDNAKANAKAACDAMYDSGITGTTACPSL